MRDSFLRPSRKTQGHLARNQDDFAAMLKIHRNPRSNHRLHLPKAPILPRRVTHQIAGHEHNRLDAVAARLASRPVLCS